MFSIYGAQGPLFRGPLEDLHRVARTLSTQPVRAVNPLTAHMDDVDAQPFQRLLQAWPDSGGQGFVHKASHAQAEAGNRVPQGRSGLYQQMQEGSPARQPLRTVAQVMHQPALAVRSQQSIADAWRTLQTADVGQAPVLNAEGKLVGLLTRAQLMRLDHLPTPDQNSLVWRAWLSQLVERVMVSPIPAVFGSTQLRRVASVLVDTGLPGLPVVSEADELVGFVSRTDVLHALTHDPPLDAWS
jgi:CBS domain-containing protein